MEKEVSEKTILTEEGTVKISDEVVAIIAGLAAAEVKGVAGMSGGIVGGIAEFVGKKSPSKGVKVEVGDKEAAVDVYVIVEFGVRIPEVAHEIQRNIKKAIESMTGLAVIEVNIHIQGVSFPSEGKEDEQYKAK
ncbi:MAG: Asp23/Gls24 family envelope stress response protein [Clostridia bacterium]|nr:Asp23/Gls24 family envelope stress response protein [Clostridia bacterium]MDD4146659.1 Asp23/Gls24 family envelope stress response protein [Clostridia bacterium]MDD4664950.1 Asp23/Gls24 family envelope stress response protein [Clostridia bacterium]